MAFDQAKSDLSPPRRLTKDVNGLFFVVGVLAVMMVSLPCPMSAANDTAPHAPETALTETKR